MLPQEQPVGTSPRPWSFGSISGAPYAGFPLGLSLLAVPWLDPVVAVGWLLTALMTRRARGPCLSGSKVDGRLNADTTHGVDNGRSQGSGDFRRPHPGSSRCSR